MNPPADGIDARGLVERLRDFGPRLRRWMPDAWADDTIKAADLIEQLLAERAVAVQAGEKIGRAKGLAYARKVSHRHTKHGSRL